MAMELLFGLQELDEQCEELLEEEFQEKTNFEVSDALQKLEKLSIISKVRGNKSCVLWTSQKLQGQNSQVAKHPLQNGTFSSWDARPTVQMSSRTYLFRLC
jgi:hypothetical protein